MYQKLDDTLIIFFFLRSQKKKKRLKKNAMIATKNDLEFMKHGI